MVLVLLAPHPQRLEHFFLVDGTGSEFSNRQRNELSEGLTGGARQHGSGICCCVVLGGGVWRHTETRALREMNTATSATQETGLLKNKTLYNVALYAAHPHAQSPSQPCPLTLWQISLRMRFLRAQD